MAAADLKTNKRKGAAEATPKPKKLKKTDDATNAKKASSKALDAAVLPLDEIAVKSRTPRKRAVDFFDDDAEGAKGKKDKKSKTATNGEADVPEEKPKKAKKPKVVAEAVVEVEVEEPKTKSKKSKKEQTEEPAVTTDKKSKKSKAAKEKAIAQLAEEYDSGSDAEDDQTAALLAGFESDRDESDEEKEDDEGAEIEIPGLSEDTRLALAKMPKGEDRDEPGVVFVGRIPHGFYEPQMKAYFKQFGKVNRLRLSRSKKTGASKHYAFVEFASTEVADIVARTMNNYLMFGHILQCRLIPADQVHPNLFVGSNGRFKRIPRNQMVGAQMARGAEREVWEKRVEKENKRRSLREKAMKEQLGYEFTAPGLKAVESVPKKELAIRDAPGEQLLLEAPAGEITLIESESTPEGVTTTETVKKSKKGPKGKADAVAAEVTEIVETVTEKKGKKGKKSKPVTVTETEEVQVSTAGGDEVVETKAVEVAVDATPDKKKSKAVEQDSGRPKRTRKAKA